MTVAPLASAVAIAKFKAPLPCTQPNQGKEKKHPPAPHTVTQARLFRVGVFDGGKLGVRLHLFGHGDKGLQARVGKRGLGKRMPHACAPQL